MLLDAVEMEDQSSESSIVGIGQLINDGVHSIAACRIVLNTSSIDEAVV